MSDLDSYRKLMKHGICRCCLSVGLYKDINATFEWMGEEEVYIDMLQECFKMELEPLEISKMSSTICELCINRLRAAYKFRLQVLKSEKSLSEKQIKMEYDDDHIFIKMEPIDDTGGDSDDNEQQDDEDDTKEKIQYKIEEKKVKVENAKVFLRKKSIPTTSIVRKSNLVVKKVQNDTMAMMLQTKNAINSYSNAILLLQNSTALPFKFSCQSGFHCFYCKEKITQSTSLRNHILTHTIEKLPTLLKKQLKTTLIMVDITDLKCRLCSEEIVDLDTLKKHLIKKHNKKLFEAKDVIVPFKLTDAELICQLCGDIFLSFQMLNKHLNSHYDNFVCETCGATFLCKMRLSRHHETHAIGNYTCKYCGKKCPNHSSLSNHEWKVHIKRTSHKCHCGAVFSSYHSKQKHRIEKHNEKHLVVTCKYCQMTFPRKPVLNNHIRRHHLKERNFKCELCGYAFFSKRELAGHNLKHTQEKVHQCEVCYKRFGRKYTLVEHMRIHNNDRRFVCANCGQAFVQKCSLKAHVAKHH